MRSILLLLFFPLFASAAPLYVRGAIGYEQSRDTTLRDVDCSATNPPALFGCGLAARGDFRNAAVPELAAGMELPMHSRVELALAHRSFELDAHSNFLNTPAPQNVRADLRSTSLMVNAALDLASTRVRPFVIAGAGVARNSLDRVTFAFPGIAASAVTITQGGTRTSLTWSAGLGLAWAIHPSLDLELTARWQDLGEIRGDAGNAHIVRPTRTIDLDIAATRADLRTAGVSVGLRWRR